MLPLIKQQPRLLILQNIWCNPSPRRSPFLLALCYLPLQERINKNKRALWHFARPQSVAAMEIVLITLGSATAKASSWDALISHCFSVKLGYFVLLARDPVQSPPFLVL